ncbi:uncharacterized protein LOC128676402 [Plodia interpunctella]|uniref:uncharacterized protein LOC128676402 n=1 Tax=Plodia interpunctella TaxID=58824 RepID=UPI002367DAB0|nr:uncharacterized protein LOC128676402 [Plodia interpunctella]
MFYPVDSLKRGGRFYLCWLADSWPERFATITQRQLWSHDIRKLCDDLLKVMTNESGRPVNRFSLRLSSQLMRGLVRLYQRKVSLYLVDLCMTNASVFKHTNKKWHIIDEDIVERVRLVERLPAPALELPEETETDRQVAQLIQNSGNIVANEQDITLREAVIPDIQLPPNDGFGEENQEQILSLALEWSVEAALAGAGGAAEVDVTVFHKSVGPKISVIPDFEKAVGPKISVIPDFEKALVYTDVSEIPDIPEIPIPELPVPVPQPENESPQRPVEPEVPMLVEEQPEPAQKVPETPVEIELQELEEIPAKRRRKNKLIIDKTKIIDSKILHARINNPKVELRCEDASDDVIPIKISVHHYFHRLAHAGYKSFKVNIANDLYRLFLRNLGAVPNHLAEEREIEELRAQLSHRRPEISILEKIDEETIHDKTAPPPVEQHIQQPIEMDISKTKDATYVVEPMEIEPPVQAVILDLPEVQPEENLQADISDLPTQKLETLSQAKRRIDAETSARKRLRPSDYKTYSLGQQQDKEAEIDNAEAEKENVPINQQSPIKSPAKSQRNVLTMLEQAGIADISEPRLTQTVDLSRRETIDPSRQEAAVDPSRTDKRDSEGSETPLGSLDRTKVSLGDSDKTTDSIRFIREQWGTVGTMTKIMKAIKSSPNRPVTVWLLTSRAPAPAPALLERKNVIAARCFNSILKLKQHGFIIIRKDPDTYEINNIILGPRFD